MSGRPDRSDTHLTPEEEVRREAEARDYFDGIAPKRHSKPSRSDFSSVYADALPPSCRDDSIHEQHKFQHLEANSLQRNTCRQSTRMISTASISSTTPLAQASSGCRNQMAASSFQITPDADASDGHVSCRGNPATNEWIPSADTVFPTSHKPNRSDV